MDSEQYSIFQVQGGIGKHVAATAVAKAIKNNFPERKLIVVCVWTEVFINLDFVDKVYPLGNTPNFYHNYVQGKESLLFANEPYMTTSHMNQKLPLIQSWCQMYNLEYNGETPEVKFNALQKKLARKHWVTNGKPIMVLQTNGGIYTDQQKDYSWTRDMPFMISQRIADYYSEQYHIYQVTKPKCERLRNVTVVDGQFSNVDLFSILLFSKKRILIDSCLQHAAAALNLPSVVLWNGTSPKVFGYDIHTNIESKKPEKYKLPNSYLFDFDFNGNEKEYPYIDFDLDAMYDPEEIFSAIESM